MTVCRSAIVKYSMHGTELAHRSSPSRHILRFQRCTRTKQTVVHALSQSSLEVSKQLALCRAQETQRTEQIILPDPCALILSGINEQDGHTFATVEASCAEAQDIIATRHIDETLLNALSATNVNGINKGDYNQVVLVGDGMDTRLWRLPIPPGTVVYCLAPSEVHQAADSALAAADIRAPRGTLMKRVAWDLQKNTGGFAEELERAGFRGDRLSIWVLQGLHHLGLSGEDVEQLLVDLANLAAFNSLVMGELPPLPTSTASNLLAEAGLLATVISYGSEAANYGRWRKDWGEAAEEAVERRLFVGQQLRLSLQEMGIYESYSAAMTEADEDFFGNFS